MNSRILQKQNDIKDKTREIKKLNGVISTLLDQINETKDEEIRNELQKQVEMSQNERKVLQTQENVCSEDQRLNSPSCNNAF